MARLIPSFTDERTPPGEIDVFNLLHDGPDDWIALHSLDLSPWNRGLRTEIDFVVVIPDGGILCVEVKSHENLAFENGEWYPSTIKRSPFKQAVDGRYTFRRRLIERAAQFQHVPVVHLCIFPRARFRVDANLAVQAWEVIDMSVIRALRSGDAFCAELRKRLQMGIKADGSLQALSRPLEPRDVEHLINICLPVQTRRPDLREEIVRREEDLSRLLRDQQKSLLQLCDSNERVIVTGGAGTGKTLMAMTIASRAVQRGRRTALLCFNQLIGDWMTERLQPPNRSSPLLVAGRAIRVMAGMAGIPIPTEPSELFWNRDLPQLLEDRLTDPEFKAEAQFDLLVLDEAQDLLARPTMFNCLVNFLWGGLAGGSFVLLGDFEHQVLRERDLVRGTLETILRSSNAARWKLTENCRNYRIVGETAVKMSGFGSAVYSGYLRAGGSVANYDISFYKSDDEQLTILTKLLCDFRNRGFLFSEITILSMRADDRAAATRIQDSTLRLRPVRQAGDSVGYASIEAYKGMENKIIIVTDLLLGDKDFQRDLLYTALTRSTESVRLLCDHRSRDTLLKWLS